jgi:LacI family transcriptional regulator
MANSRKVALLIETSNAYGRGLLRGIHAYAEERGNWTTNFPEQARGDDPPPWLSKGWRGDGIIARVENRRIAQILKKTGLPVVNVSTTRIPDWPQIASQPGAVVRLAVDHLVERGFRNFAFCGDDRFAWSHARCNDFRSLISELGFNCEVYGASRLIEEQPSWDQQERELSVWLRNLPKPVGVMASHDERGLQLVQLCRRISITVPDEAAIIGVDNDELLCNFAVPALSSVIQDTYRIGYEAAQILDRVMSGKPVNPTTGIKPLGIAVRASTDTLAVADPDVSKAVKFIREHACNGINVSDVLEQVQISRRMLEHRFKKVLGHTPHAEILRYQLERVVELLTDTDLPLASVARRAGFQHAEYLSVAFKRHYGVPPSEFRRKHRR